MNVLRLCMPLVSLALLVPSLALAEPVSDRDKAIARELVNEGYSALEKKDYTTAADRLSRANALYPAPSVLLGLARANVGLGKLVSAQELYSRLIHEPLPPNSPPLFVQAVEDARKELAALSPRIPSIILQVVGAEGPKVSFDDGEVPAVALAIKMPADPGKHIARAAAPGFLPKEVAVTLVEGKTETVTIKLDPAPPGDTSGSPSVTLTPAVPSAVPTPSDTGPDTKKSVLVPSPNPESGAWKKTAGFVGIGVGGAALVTGVATGILALTKNSDLATLCPGGACPEGKKAEIQPKIDSYMLMKSVSIATLIGGGVLGTAGIVLVATSPRKAPEAKVSAILGVGYIGVKGSFE